MRFLGHASRLLKNVRPQIKYFTSIRYRTSAQYVNSIPTSPIMADSPKSSLPQTRVLSESEVDEPEHKKPRLDDHGKETNIASTSQPTKNNGLDKRMKKKNKKRGEPPLPELCSAADVLYQEIRSILGGGVVDGVTAEGGAFKSPYSQGDEVEVTIDRMTAGGKF
jgi:tRNA (uracil-5-)-methyltransferase